MKKLCSSLFLSSICFTAFTQENQFVVYSVKGNVSIVEKNVESKAKIGTLVLSGATIKVPQGSFATLICNETRAFTLNKAGSYKTASLTDSCKVGSGSLSSNYMKYVWSEMTKPKGSPEKNRKNYMANVGAVSRGINNIWIDPKLDTVNYVSGTVRLSWKSFTDDTDEFEFKLFETAESTSPLTVKIVKKKHVDIKDLLTTIKPGKTYYWTAMVKGEDNEDRKYLKYWTKEEYSNFYNSVKDGGAAETDAEKNFRLGFVLEEAHFIAEAYDYYLKATQLAPDNVFYRSTFMSFKKDYEIK